MRVRHLAFGLGLGGTERAAQNFALETARMGHYTDVVVMDDGPRRAVLEELGVPVIVAGSSSFVFGDLMPADVVVVHSHGVSKDFVAAVLDASGKPAVAEINVFSEPTAWMVRVDVSFQLSPWAHWLYVERGGDANRSSTLAYPVETESFAFDSAAADSFRDQHDIPASAPLIGRVGQPLVNKWSPLLVPACHRVMSEQSDVHIAFVGAPDEVVQAVEQHLDPRRVTLIERLSSDVELRGAYSAIDVFAHTARQGESFGYVLAETCLSQTAVVTMATPWADNSQGYVAGPSARVAITPAGFTEHLRAAVEQTRLTDARRTTGLVGRQHIIDNFAAPVVTQVMLGTVLGDKAKIPPPSAIELTGSMYFGSDGYLGGDLMRRWPRSRINAVLSHQESLRWLASQYWVSVRG